MPDTFPLGSIPPLSAWEGEKLTFKVTSTLGAGVSFRKRAVPSPKGKISIDEKTGEFNYTPAPEDRDDFVVWIQARKAARDEKQKVFITPHPRLPSEFNAIEHVSRTPPDRASRLYATYAEENAGEFRFNDIEEIGSDSRAKVMTQKVTASGVRLVLEKKGSGNWLYEKLKDRKTLKELVLCADEVVVRCELKVPGTDVKIYARSLRFDDSAGETARIDTTPLSVQTRSAKDEGLDGQKAGDVYLFVSQLETPGTAHRVIANGSDGQKARLGERGTKGADKQEWNGKLRVENKDFDISQDIRETVRDGEKCIGVAIFQEIPLGGRKKKEERRQHYDVGDWTDKVKGWPGNGQDPKVLPGRPGQGGGGGTITTAFVDQLRPRVKQEAGQQGALADDIKPADPGQPVKALTMKFVYRMDIRGATMAYASPHDARTSKPGKEAKAQPSQKPAPNGGELKAIPPTDTSFWAHPASARALVSYLEDAMLTGHAETVAKDETLSPRALLALHLEAVKAAASRAGADLEWQALYSELTAFVQRIEGPYDYFGNPAGWVPMLSFQANLSLYEKEVEAALPIMFLAYWVENHQSSNKKARDVLVGAMERLRTETQQAIDSYDAAQKKLISLDERSDDIKKELKDRKSDLELLIKRRKQETKDNLKVEHFWRASAKIVGGILQLIPVGQPVLGAIGKSAVVLSDIDLDSPTEKLGDLAGAWSTVASDKIAPKFSKLLAGAKSAKEEEEKEPVPDEDDTKAKFDKEVAKKKLDEKVKAHMKEQKQAKDDIVAGFKGFAVSEDDVKERLEHVLAQSPEFKQLTEKIEELNKSKAKFAEELFAALQAIDQAGATIVKNQMALIEMRAQLGATLDKLNAEALQYVQGMGQRARARLQLYKYYLLKSYHYLTLEPLPIIDFRALKVFDEFAKLLPNSPDGMLPEEKYKNLVAVFKSELREVAQQIIAFYQSHKGRKTGEFTLALTKEQLETLNASPFRIEFDLLWKLDTAREDLRITGIETTSVKLATPLPADLLNIGLDYRHDGLSRVRRGGQLFLFRSGEFRAGESNKGTRSDAISWGADVKFDPDPPEGQKPLTWTETGEDPETNWLIRDLIGDTSRDSPLLSFRPSAWTTLTVKRTGVFAGKLSELKLKVKYVYYPVKDDVFSTVVVKVAGDAQPLIRCDTPDANNRADGQGSFVRTFEHQKRRNVTLTAPASYGRRAFKGWRTAANTEGKAPEASSLNVSKLIEERALTLDVRAVHDHLVEPVYEPTEFVPVNDRDEEWPLCPVGWNFDDWVFVNGTTSELSVEEIIAGPTEHQKLTPAVNTPQGTNLVQLSFERIKLLPGESTKLSVCINPDGNGIAGMPNISFWWKANDAYKVVFDALGQLRFVQRLFQLTNKWVQAETAFDVDRENRVIAFARTLR